jgi:outer membrane protein W
MKKIFLSLLLLLAIGVASQAQKAASDWYQRNMMTLNWQFASPTNPDYLSNTSWVGGNFEFRHFVNKKISVGAGLSWNSFEQYFEPQVYEKPDGSQAFYTDMVRQVYTLPLYANVHYYFDGGAKIKPYVGLGIGGQYSEQSAYYNVFVSESNNWGFAVRPEVGAMYKLGPYFGLHANVGYSYATNKNEDFKMDDFKHIYYSIGAWWNVF